MAGKITVGLTSHWPHVTEALKGKCRRYALHKFYHKAHCANFTNGIHAFLVQGTKTNNPVHNGGQGEDAFNVGNSPAR